MGPLITREHLDKVRSYVDGANDEGADVVADGPPLDTGRQRVLPRVHVARSSPPGMRAYDDEIFGPVLSVVRVADVRRRGGDLVNDNPYGNGVAIFTRDGGAARQFQFDIQVGMVGINVPIPVPVSFYCFGGWKSSLFGDTHMYGPEGVRFYTRAKVVTSRWPDPATSAIDLGFPQSR